MFEPGILRTLPDQEQCANSTSHGLVLVLVEIALPLPYRKIAYDCFRGPCACIDESAADDFYRPGIVTGPRIWAVLFFACCQGGTYGKQGSTEHTRRISKYCP
jgi:hypothetical protein